MQKIISNQLSSLFVFCLHDLSFSRLSVLVSSMLSAAADGGGDVEEVCVCVLRGTNGCFEETLQQ